MTLPSVSRGREMPRKTLHLTTAVVPFALWFGAPQRVVAVLLLLLFGIACAMEFARRRSSAVAARFEATVGVMLRPHEATNAITGATWLLAAFALTTLAAPLGVAIAATWAGAVGDALAAIVGTAWRRARGGTGKSTAGSVACAVATALGAWWLAGAGIAASAAIGLVAAALERPVIALDDNVRVTFGVAVASLLLFRL